MIRRRLHDAFVLILCLPIVLTVFAFLTAIFFLIWIEETIRGVEYKPPFERL